MLSLAKIQGRSPSRCGTTNGIRCWRTTLRAHRLVDHWCDDVNKHLGACVCAGCGDIIATRRMLPVPSIERRSREAERAAVDRATIRSSNAEIRRGMLGLGVRLLIVAGGGRLARLGIDGRLATIMALMLAVIFAGIWYLTSDEV